MNEGFLGIDLGTSSVKVLLITEEGVQSGNSAVYEEISPAGWMDAVRRALRPLRKETIRAIGLSSQVGTYIVDETTVIPWNSPEGKEELHQLKARYPKERFIEETAMPHPDILSYPLPRLLYIMRRYPNVRRIAQPKDLLLLRLTGQYASDPYSWRGLADSRTGRYSQFFLRETGVQERVLPKLLGVQDQAGTVREEAARFFGLSAGIPVYTGMNDFFCSLLGMGMTEPGALFDITGTSEHVGVLLDRLAADTPLVASPFFDHFVHYGVTASSGASIDFAKRAFGLDHLSMERSLRNQAPVFLPYVNGERAPVFDSDARGVFFGIGGATSNEEMAYAVLEGCAFSGYHIYETLGAPAIDSVLVSGGAAGNEVLNSLKAELYQAPVHRLAEQNTSALGAALIAAAGDTGRSPAELAKIYRKTAAAAIPCGKYRGPLARRYHIYKNLYPLLKEQFALFAEAKEQE